jgi:aldehyde:ferredoxin oxidoreductase
MPASRVVRSGENPYPVISLQEVSMGFGYMGKVLVVDLSARKTHEEHIPHKIYENYLSGLGLAAHLLCRWIPVGAHPLGPDNVLGFMSGLLTGTGSLFTGRWMAVGKSPLTGGWGDANCGGNFSPAIKQCGYDGIFFFGISTTPVYLFADGSSVEIRDASHLWGMDAIETEKFLQTGLGGKKRVRVACIGPAGEKRSLISGIVNDGGRLAARSGLGAVMGSKKLKAVVLGGSKRISPRHRSEIRRLSLKCNETVKFQPPFVSGTVAAYMGAVMRLFPAQMETDGMLYKIMLRKWGTVSMNQMSIEMGDAPIKNWKGTNEDFDLSRSSSINPDVFTQTVIAKYFCYSCPLGCGGICTMDEKGKKSHRPEYETVLSLGGLCLNEDAESIFYLNDLLNRAGMDTISAGGTVAFAMECYEKGILTKADTDGLDLTWGNSGAIVKLVEKMIRREGIGDLLADGSKAAARKIGKNAASYAMEAGGQELGMHDGRFDPGFALHNSVEPAPGRHTIGSQLYYEMFRLWKKIPDLPDPDFLYLKGGKFEAGPEKAMAGAACSKFMNVVNGAGCCLFGTFLGVHRIPIFEWINAATGWEKTPEEYMEIGERIQTLRQWFNVRHGISPASYKVNKRALGRPPQKKGANKGRTVAIEKMMSDYWKAFQWDPQTGKPTLSCLKRLNIATEDEYGL